MQRIAVIGGGAAGSAVVAHCLRDAARGDRHAPRNTLTWIVGDQAPGRGIAYRTVDEQHLLNVRAANMSLFADHATDFLDYASARGIAAADGQFLPRAIYGDYVEATLARLLRDAHGRLALNAHSTEAVALHPLPGGGFDIRMRDGGSVRADGVVLALGALPPAILPGVSAAAASSGAYAGDPWAWPEPARPPAHVLVIGTGLTAVDAILSAAARWPQARLTAVSRRGRLPALHADGPLSPYSGQDELLARLGGSTHLADWLRAVRLATSTPDTDWRAVLDSVRAALPRCWQALDPIQRARFLRHLRPHWEVVRHRMPARTAARLQALHDAGRLRILAARIRAVEGGDAGLRITLRLRGSAQPLAMNADFGIQATGLDSDVRTTAHTLVRQLVQERLVQPDALGLGLAAGADGRLLDADGRPRPGFYAIGALLRGTLWECTAMPEIRGLARSIAADLRAAPAPAPRLVAV